MKVSYTVKSEIGKVRSHQEDSWGIEENTPNGKVYVVCDGMGGHVGGATASRLAVTSILDYFKRKKYENLIQHIDKAFEFANEQIFAHTLADPGLKGMGTTAVILIIKNEECYIGHVGDSRIYLRTLSKLHRLTKDHSFVQELVSQGIITDDQAETHPKKNQILKALGHSSVIEGTVCKRPFKVKTGDTFLLCSDGLNGMVNDEVMESIIIGNDLNQIQEKLFEVAMANGGNDNVTFILVNVIQSDYHGNPDFQSFNPIERGRIDEDAFSNTTTSFNVTETPFKRKESKKKLLIPILSGLLILSFSFGLYQYFKSKSPKKSEIVTNAGQVNNPKSLAELRGLNLEQLKDLVTNKATVINVSNGETITTKDQKDVKLSVNDNLLTSVDVVEIKTYPTDASEQTNEVQNVSTSGSTSSTSVTKEKDNDNDGFIGVKDLCPGIKGANNGCPCQVPPDKKDFKWDKNGNYKIQTQADGETINHLIRRIKDLGINNPGNKEEIGILNQNNSSLTKEEKKAFNENELFKFVGKWIIFRNHDCYQ